MKLRPATMEDKEELFFWKNDPQTRKYAIATHREITWEKHVSYLTERLQRGGFYVIEIDDTKAGSLRVEPDGEVAIYITHPYRRKGYAQQAVMLLTERPLYAKIVNGNIGSLRLFVKLGFLPVAYDKKGYYTLERT